MQIVRLAVLEGPNEFSEDAVLSVELQVEPGDDLRRHRMSAFHSLVTATIREFRDPDSAHDASRIMAASWQRTPEELIALTIAGLHRAAGLDAQARVVSVEDTHWRILVQPAGSRATRRAVELAVDSFRDFLAGRSVDLRRGVLAIRRLAALR
ncbi:MAG: hypothetical protein GX774_05215 [Armatimonadetes bacterium]|jgi:hypothetical protein|nr:hypothetical protein [Armatimonadota bacterium]